MPVFPTEVSRKALSSTTAGLVSSAAKQPEACSHPGGGGGTLGCPEDKKEAKGQRFRAKFFSRTTVHLDEYFISQKDRVLKG